MCPFINSKVYLNDLARQMAVKTPQVVKVIIGPKDAGKSTGIIKFNFFLWFQTVGLLIVLFTSSKS